MKKLRLLGLSLLVASGITQRASAQDPDKYLFSNKIFNLQFLYNYHVPSGDFSKTYGNFNSIGFGGLLKQKSNWTISGEMNYIFGREILESHLFDNLVTSSGYIGSVGGAPANYSVNMRGYSAYLKGGRVFALNHKNMNSGVMVNLGVGVIQHRINIQTQQLDIPQLDANYKKGYDRLSNGISFTQFVGYHYQSQNRLVNFYIGMEFMEARVYNQRKYNYDQMAYDHKLQKNYTTSFRFGWMIPIYLNTKEENEFQFK